MPALPFHRARAFVHRLKLTSVEEWKEWSKSGQRPSNVPGRPDQVYKDTGWVSWPDWMGYTDKKRGSKLKRMGYEQAGDESERGENPTTSKRARDPPTTETSAAFSLPSSPFRRQRRETAASSSSSDAHHRAEETAGTGGWKCSGCLASLGGKLGAKFGGCGHRFCRSCFRSIAQVTLESEGAIATPRGGVVIVSCPACRRLWRRGELQLRESAVREFLSEQIAAV